MDNYEAIAYAVMALDELKKEGKEITTDKLKAKMLYLMDMNSEKATFSKKINKKSSEKKNFIIDRDIF